jgi:hypothetical protein
LEEIRFQRVSNGAQNLLFMETSLRNSCFVKRVQRAGNPFVFRKQAGK